MIKQTIGAVGSAVFFAACLWAQAPPPAKKSESAKPSAVRRTARRPATSAPRFTLDNVQTNQTKNDWEEINFEFNSAIVSDGFPTLLWLADFLKNHPDYRVRIVGHTDYVGSNAYNNALGMARAESVATFLRKYGATPGQLSTAGEGKRQPEVDNRTKENRFVNRRVILTVTDGQGRQMSLEDLIKSQMKPGAGAAAMDCCADILKRLDKLDDILDQLRRLKGEHDKLEGEIADLRNQLGQRPAAPAPTPSTVSTVAEKAAENVAEEISRRNKKFSLLGLNVGPTYGPARSGNFTASGRGQFFSPFGGDGTHAVQAQAEYMYYPGRQEGQFDIGLVNRWDNFQAGLFGSFKYLNFRQYQNGGGLAQASFVADYLFSRGRVGVFGSKGFKNIAVLNRQTLAPGAFLETYARLVDQVGASAQVGAWGDAYFEGNLAYLRMRGSSDKPGGTLRLVQPLNSLFALTAELGYNETFVGNGGSGRVVFGFQFGNFIRPKDYLNVKSPVPMDIPRIRYELLTRRVGASPPVADAGPDQIGVRPGTITLNGSNSRDPLGLPLTYHWDQIGGPSVSLSGANTAIATFTAVEGQIYIFRLTVTNTDGLSSTARTTVSTITIPNIQIVRFSATPDTITSGQCSILEWNVENAETVSIDQGVGDQRPQGTKQVCPTQTTTYTLTAKNATNGKQATASVTVTVNAPGPSNPQILRFEASPTNILTGESSTLSWTTQNAVRATINGQSVALNGSMVVSPTQTTSYTLVADGGDGRTVSAVVVVTVTTGQVPRIVTFSATPTNIDVGGSAQICWQVDNATSVSINPGLGAVKAQDCASVSPTTTTTYVLTATNPSGTVTASATVVVGFVKILSFTNDPLFSTKSGDPVTLSWTTSGASSVVLTGAGLPPGPYPVNGSIVVNPTTNVDYTLTAYGPSGQVVSAVLHVFVR